jgi:hypothetical protein
MIGCKSKEKDNKSIFEEMHKFEVPVLDDYNNISCSEGEDLARENIERNNIYIYVFISDNVNYQKLLEDNYNILCYRLNLNENEAPKGYLCYNKIIKTEIEEKYGKGFLKEIEEKSKGHIEEAKFGDSDTALREFIFDNLDFSLINDSIKLKTIYISFKVDSIGKLMNIKIEKGINKIIDEEILKIFNISPNWQPATLDGKSIKRKYIISVDLK